MDYRRHSIRMICLKLSALQNCRKSAKCTLTHLLSEERRKRHSVESKQRVSVHVNVEVKRSNSIRKSRRYTLIMQERNSGSEPAKHFSFIIINSGIIFFFARSSIPYEQHNIHSAASKNRTTAYG